MNASSSHGMKFTALFEQTAKDPYPLRKCLIQRQKHPLCVLVIRVPRFEMFCRTEEIDGRTLLQRSDTAGIRFHIRDACFRRRKVRQRIVFDRNLNFSVAVHTARFSPCFGVEHNGHAECVNRAHGIDRANRFTAAQNRRRENFD